MSPPAAVPKGPARQSGRTAVELSKGHVDRVLNMLKVPGVHQVMLRVKIAELNRTAARNFGVNFSATAQFRNGSLLLQSLLNASTTIRSSATSATTS